MNSGLLFAEYRRYAVRGLPIREGPATRAQLRRMGYLWRNLRTYLLRFGSWN